MDPITIGLLLGGTALSTVGGMSEREQALENAKRQAAARNAVLKDNIAKQEGFFDQNKGVWDANIGRYAQPAQEQQLQMAQDTRSAGNVGNITKVDTTSVPTQADASPAVKSEIAKRMLATFNQSTDRAKQMGKLGGYSDTWLENQLGNRQADRDIGVTNTFSAGRKALLGPEQDAASAEAYQPPSVMPGLMKGAGSLMSGAAGAGMFSGAGGGMTGFSPDGSMFFGNGSQSSMGGGAGGGVWGR